MRLGQVNGLLVLGLGLLWRGRDRTWAAGAATAAVVVAKLFLWPMGLFLLLTRRRRHAAAAVLLGAVSVLAGWAVIGFNGLGSYPAMVGHLSAIEGPAGISLVSLASSLGLGSGIGVAAAWLSCAGVLVLAALVLRGDGAEDRAFALCVVAGLLGSTLVWPHYFVLLYVAIALLSPRLGPLWLIPLVTWLAPVELTHGSAWRIAVYLVLELTVVAVLVARPLLAFLRQRARVTAASTP
jgi:hypothetical protein